MPHALRRRLGRAAPPREALVAGLVPGRSFLDVGCMWSVDGAIAFHAEAAGATAVTGVDVMAPTARFEAEHARRGSRVRFVAGDLHDPALVEEVGVHDVVWCSGVLYHAPHPVLTLQRLRALTGQTLVLATETLPRRGTACLFAPPPHSHPAQAEPLDPARGYAGWWWGISPGALRAMLAATGFAVEREHRSRFHTTAIARPVGAPPPPTPV